MLDPYVVAVFGDAAAREQWFKQLIESALVAPLTNAYADFSTIGGAALEMTAVRRGMTLSDDARHGILEAVQHLPAHPDVRESLDRLRDAGLRLAALTNSPPRVAEAQLTNAGIRSYFEQALSVDEVRRFKPAPAPYRMAAQRLGVPVSGVRLIAAHAWDVAGALRAGCAAAFVARPGKVLDPLVQRPDVVGADLRDVAGKILAVEMPGR